MQDALMIYLMVANMRHAGYLSAIAGSLRHVTARYWRLRVGVARSLSEAATLISSVVRAGGCGLRSSSRTPARFQSRAAGTLTTCNDWMQALTRLESYVGAMA